MELYDSDLLTKLVKQNKKIRDKSYAEKEGKESLQTNLTELYQPLLNSQKSSSKSQVDELSKLSITLSEKLNDSKDQTGQFLQTLINRVENGTVQQREQTAKLVRTINERPILVELIKTVTPNLGRVISGETDDVSKLTKAEKRILREYNNTDDNTLRALIDYYVLEKHIKHNPNINDEPLTIEEVLDPNINDEEVGVYSDEFVKGKNTNYDNLDIVKSRKTDDECGITFDINNGYMLGDKKVYFNENNKIKIGDYQGVTYTPGLEQLLTRLKVKVSNPDITDDDIRNYIQLLKVGNVDIKDKMSKIKKLSDCYKRVDPQALQHLGNKGIKIGQGLIILPSDPNELFKRLQLNIGLYNAENKSLFNEINEN